MSAAQSSFSDLLNQQVNSILLMVWSGPSKYLRKTVNKKKMGIVKHLITAFLVGIAIFILFGILEYVYGHGFSNVRELLLFFSFSQLYTVTLYMVNAYYFGLLLKWFPNEVFKAKNLAKGIFGGVLLTALVLFLIRAFLETLVKGRTLIDFFDHV